MHYVSLSRVRNSSALHKLNLKEKEISVSEQVKEDMVKLKSESLVPCISFLYSPLNQNAIKILFHNVEFDYNVQTADVNIFVETALYSSDSNLSYQISGFELFRNDFDQHSITRTCYGT